MKLSISNIAWSEEQDKEMYEYISKQKIQAVEIAPTRIFKEAPYEKLEEAKMFADELRANYHIEVSSMQSILFGKKENIFGSEEEKEELTSYIKKAIDFASVMRCRNLVFGCPKNRILLEKSKYDESVEFFKFLGDYAENKNTVLSIEPNPAIYHTNFINETNEAFELVRQVSSEGFKVNVDVGTIVENNEELSVLKENINLINHVHISEPFLAVIEKRKLHKQLSEILQHENYTGFVSIEMKNFNDIALIKSTMEYVKEVFT